MSSLPKSKSALPSEFTDSSIARLNDRFGIGIKLNNFFKSSPHGPGLAVSLESDLKLAESGSSIGPATTDQLLLLEQM